MTKGAKIIELLKTVNPETIWGVSIQKVVNAENADKIVDLVIDLRDQARDSPAIMKDILGAECFKAVMSI